MSGIVHTYYENHKDSIVEYANENKLDGDAMDYDETNIHIRHLAQYFAWTGHVHGQKSVRRYLNS